MLTGHGDWMALGNADEQKPALPPVLEALGLAEWSTTRATTGCARAERARPCRRARPFVMCAIRAAMRPKSRTLP
jgi:hypothetical protein